VCTAGSPPQLPSVQSLKNSVTKTPDSIVQKKEREAEMKEKKVNTKIRDVFREAQVEEGLLKREFGATHFTIDPVDGIDYKMTYMAQLRNKAKCMPNDRTFLRQVLEVCQVV
jgi:hypothetical protein